MSDKMAAPAERVEGVDNNASKPPWQRPYVTPINQLQIPVPLPSFPCLDVIKEDFL